VDNDAQRYVWHLVSLLLVSALRNASKHDTLSWIIEEMQYLALGNVAGISPWDAEEDAFLFLVSFIYNRYYDYEYA
jgi:hypothetical protein